LSRQKKPIESSKSQLNRQKKPIESLKKSQLKKMVAKKPQSSVVLLFLPDIINMQAGHK